jgi:hypothetical protein
MLKLISPVIPTPLTQLKLSGSSKIMDLAIASVTQQCISFSYILFGWVDCRFVANEQY